MSLTVQFVTIVTMIGSGFYLGMAVETFYRFYNRKRYQQIFRYINEGLFWVLQGLILFYILYLVNYGEIRFYILLAVICGYAAYQSMFRTTFLKILEISIRWAATIYRFCKQLCNTFIFAPLRWMLMVLKSILLLLWGVVIWLIILPWRLIKRPIQVLGKLLWGMVPKIIKKYILSLWQYCSKMIYMVQKWYKSMLQKRR
ncbi:spore cortex biosynthesis protein YabQ [Salirhabdus salicampi]|uniref:spore cortex biosynthesis protein YabQ n=1 Tax=Salirhabdus salicampi TaxID=476102 RepID=UPI0020C46273|nr:spore cortex biosynthesis protein YabQ [Salirhabdus salicampi]MCP8618182.1 spore cortex biosynthesis protein YabQ [Salirhabdus salicampi]